MLNVTPAPVLRRAGLFCALSALAVLPAGAASQFVAAGGDLQAALNQAQPGDVITLAAGATFIGNFTLAPNNVANYIQIQSSAMADLPGPGNRITPAQAGNMPKLVSPNAGAALTIPSGANYYYIQGIEFTVTPGDYSNGVIQAGTASETSVDQLPYDIVFDRDYVHGDPNSGSKRGLALNSGLTVVKGSYFKDFTSDWQDTQAICGWNGPGPYTIQNNHLEAGAEIVAFGGATTTISGVIPSNIVVKDNEFYKPMSWWSGSPNYIGRHIRAKNHFELKNAQNVLLENNTFTNNFVGADQLGFMVLLNVRDEYGAVPWATVSNVTVKNNLFQHTAAGVFLMGHDGDGGGTAGNFTFSNNTWLDMGGYGGDGRMYEILSGVHGITIDHDTAFPTGWPFVFSFQPSSGLKVTNSIYTAGAGIAGDGGHYGEDTLNLYASDAVFANNAFIGGWPWGFTGPHFSNSWLPASVSDVGFQDFVRSNVQLATNSSFQAQATDGLALGSAFTSQSSAPVSNTLNSVNTLSTLAATNAINSTLGLGIQASWLAPNGWVSIISKQSGKCMDLPFWDGSNWGQNPGTPITQHTCWGGDMQQFQFWPVYDGYKITIKQSNQQFDMAGGPGATSPGMPLGQWPYWGGTNEIFQLSYGANPWLNDGYVTLHPVHTGMCLALADDSQADGVAIVQEPCTGADDQQWKLVPVQ